jgi:hypothetical protein
MKPVTEKQGKDRLTMLLAGHLWDFRSPATVHCISTTTVKGQTILFSSITIDLQ